MSVEFKIESMKDIAALVNAIHLMSEKPVYTHVLERKIINEKEDRFTGEWNCYISNDEQEMFRYSHGIPIADYWKFRIDLAYRKGEDVKLGPVMDIVYQSMINDEYADKIGKCD